MDQHGCRSRSGFVRSGIGLRLLAFAIAAMLTSAPQALHAQNTGLFRTDAYLSISRTSNITWLLNYDRLVDSLRTVSLFVDRAELADTAAVLRGLIGSGSPVDTAKLVSMNRQDAIIYGLKIFDYLHSLKLVVARSPFMPLAPVKLARFAYDTTAGGSSRDTVLQVVSNLGVTALTIQASGITSLPSQSGARVYRSTTQSYTAGYITQINWSHENFDNRNEHNLTTDNFTATVPGAYLITAAVEATVGSATENTYLLLYKNNNQASTGAVVHSSSTGFVQFVKPTFSDVLYLNAGDFVDLRFYCPVDATILGGSDITRMSVVKIF